MNKIKIFLGYTIAGLSFVIVMAGFIGMDFWGKSLVDITGVKISPWYTGGEVVRTIDHQGYQTVISRPVFDGLFWPRSEGFVQIGLKPLSKLPAAIDEDIDFDNDKTTDFNIKMDLTPLSQMKSNPEISCCKADIKAYNARVTGLEGVYKLKNSIVIRVSLKNTK